LGSAMLSPTDVCSTTTGVVVCQVFLKKLADGGGELT
jgi:hypothetical protein